MPEWGSPWWGVFAGLLVSLMGLYVNLRTSKFGALLTKQTADANREQEARKAADANRVAEDAALDRERAAFLATVIADRDAERQRRTDAERKLDAKGILLDRWQAFGRAAWHAADSRAQVAIAYRETIERRIRSTLPADQAAALCALPPLTFEPLPAHPIAE